MMSNYIRHLSIWQGRPDFPASLGDTCLILSTGERYVYTSSGWVAEDLLRASEKPVEKQKTTKRTNTSKTSKKPRSTPK